MKKIVLLVAFLLVTVFSLAQDKKVPEGAMSGDFKIDRLCLLTASGNCPHPKLVLKVSVWVTTGLINQKGLHEFERYILESSNAFYFQNGVVFDLDSKINPVVQDSDDDTCEGAKAIPREKNTLLVFLSHVPPVSTPYLKEREFIKVACAGSGWIAVWIDPRDSREKIIRAINHEVGHQFGLEDSDDPASAMCTEKNTITSEKQKCFDSIYFSGPELEAISRVVAVMQKISFETYSGLMGKAESYEVYEITHNIIFENKKIN